MLQGKAGLPAQRRPQPLNERTNGRRNGRTGHRIPRIIVVHVSSAVCGVGQRGPSSSLAVAAKAITSLAVHAVPPLLPSLLPPFGSSLPWLYQRESDDTALNGGGCVAVGTKVSAMMVAAVAVCRLRTSLPEQCSLHVNDFSRAAAAAFRAARNERDHFSPRTPSPHLVGRSSFFVCFSPRSTRDSQALHLSFLVSIHLVGTLRRSLEP